MGERSVKRRRAILSNIQTEERVTLRSVRYAIERASIFARRVYTLARWIASPPSLFFIRDQTWIASFARWKVSQASNRMNRLSSRNFFFHLEKGLVYRGVQIYWGYEAVCLEIVNAGWLKLTVDNEDRRIENCDDI